MRWRDALVTAGIASVATLLTASPALDRLDGFTIDALFWLRHQLYGPLHEPRASPTVVIAIDEETYRRPPFEGLPKAMWTPQLARVLTATLDAGAHVIGQDVILPTSVEKYLRGFDREYLLALKRGAAEGRLVLGKVQHSQKPISPFPGYSFAVGNELNIRLVNLFRDDDGVIRRIPLRFRTRGTDGFVRVEPSMALELAARALGKTVNLGDDSQIALGGYAIPGSSKNAMLLNFDTGGGSIPTYSLVDLSACAEVGLDDFFRKHFANKVIVVGAVLDVEDRKTTSVRLASGPEGAWLGERCVLPVMPGLYSPQVFRETIPGVFLFATAVNNILRHDALRELDPIVYTGLGLLLALAAGSVGLLLNPAKAWLILLAGALLWTLAVTAVFRGGLILPLFDPLAASAITFAMLLSYRFGIADKQKRAIRRAFAYYLPGPVIDRMTDGDRMPTLGGETRELTVSFFDLAGFTSLSEGMSPNEVVRFMNGYLNEMTEVIEDHGGFVDKYIGDAIVAVFGAPLDDPDHAVHAVEAALACQRRLAEITPELGLPEGRNIVCRIGGNSGPTLIGNIGSRRRFNYTVMGDTVNLAARLEGVNKIYSTRVLVSEHTARFCDAEFALREVDTVRVLGRDESIRIYEPWGHLDDLTDEQRERLKRYATALHEYRAGDFVAAAELFESIADHDPTAGYMAARASDLVAEPPPSDWRGVHDLDQK